MSIFYNIRCLMFSLFFFSLHHVRYLLMLQKYYASHSISPRNLMLCGMLSQIICGCSLAFIDVFWIQCVVRWLCSVSCAQMYTAGTVICKCCLTIKKKWFYLFLRYSKSIWGDYTNILNAHIES